MKPHWSASALSLFLRCGEAWFQRYVEKRRGGGRGIPAHLGTAIHKCASHNFEQKLETHRDLPVSQIVEVAVETFRSDVEKGVYFTPEEEAAGFNVSIGDGIDEASRLAKAHAKHQAPVYQPVAPVERTVRLELPGPRDLLGVIDLTGVQVRHPSDKEVVDFKNVKRKRSQAECSGDLQGTIYHVLEQAETGVAPKAVVFDQLVKRKTEIGHERIVVPKNPAQIVSLAATIDAANLAVEKGVFLPARVGSDWWCSPTYCEFFKTCRYVQGHQHGHKATPNED